MIVDAAASTAMMMHEVGCKQLCDDGNETNHCCGVGTEWAVTDRVSIKSDALYLQLQNDSFNRTNALSGPGETKGIDHLDSV
jgi:opacity protein-like surface antigen